MHVSTQLALSHLITDWVLLMWMFAGAGSHADLSKLGGGEGQEGFGGLAGNGPSKE